MYPIILEQSSHSILIGLSETEVGKILLPNTMVLVDAETGEPVNLLSHDEPTLKKEAAALQFANTINDLMPQFYRIQPWQTEDGKEHEMMVMERLYCLPIHHFELPLRQEMMSRFEEKLKELHSALFVHGDLMRPTRFFNRGDNAWIFENIVQTENGLRLIDAGFAKIGNQENLKTVVQIILQEEEEVDCFRDYYFS